MLQRLILVLSLSFATPVLADEPEILGIEAKRDHMGWRFDVTLAHPDTGWDHYADGWEVLDANGNRLAIRELMHPHIQEQPFTRSLANVLVPDGMRKVYIRARCSHEGWSKKTYLVDLTN